jgi:hypothetical protein
MLSVCCAVIAQSSSCVNVQAQVLQLCWRAAARASAAIDSSESGLANHSVLQAGHLVAPLLFQCWAESSM